ncbi:hypothetical protein, partial [uncultured Thiohalocapsa sp.]|uniref:hypothetical protein n=1 Tax=uncultured Thiohalocapsa sp. TaxID=768990 RepID=UPI0025EEEE62
CQGAFFASSSGHCGFDCQYCIINPIAKHQPSLVFEDFRFICEYFDAPVFFALSGVGDFMVSYARSQRLLERLLGLDVEVALDTNGAALQELPELAPERLEKIRYINLTMHYHQIKQKNLLERWPANARTILERRFEQTHPDYILSPPLQDEWEEAIALYADKVYAQTARPLLLVRDVNRPFSAADEDRLASLRAKFGEVLAGEHREDFAAGFRDRSDVLCPAGMRYFRVWNDGRVQGCPNLPHVTELSDCGNVKERRLNVSKTPFRCRSPNFCDCHVIDGLGMMRVPSNAC